MADSLTKYGLYIDDLSKICILEPEVANQTNKLKEECQNFVTKNVETFERSRRKCFRDYKITRLDDIYELCILLEIHADRINTEN
ncbi:hypothetical protein HZH66_010032 [Vespula vulgaris]|uniref:Uncharacterized protein n=1 Tax=Vespula vulgaris TaxID=7454 RepID=A0A834MY70_VESVU|nr:hypothetical protein HZH66_010032 [Vespula vulgaris]